MKYSVPKGDGECLFYPPWEEALDLIEANHSLLEGGDFEMAGAPFHSLRASVRRKVAAQAGQHVSGNLRIVVGAHQPGFHGPGILCKHGVLEAFSRHNLSVNFVVDSDVCKEVSVKIPCLHGERIGLKVVVIFPNRDGVVFEKLCVPPKQAVDLRYSEIEKLLEPVAVEGIVRAFKDFRAVHERVYVEGASAAKVLTDYRQAHYPTPGVHDSFISAISRSEEFLIYACDIIRRIKEFHAAYNSSLNEHRRLHGIRSPANPFPELVRDGELWELPFWGLGTQGSRHKLFAGGTAGKRFVVANDGSGRVSPVAPETAPSLRLRPRAVCLTMFLRLFVGDLFVHGVGGGNYDRVTDRIIESYYGPSPPGYVVCSRTKFLSDRWSGVLEQKAEELREKLRRMRHVPERFSPDGDALAAEASRILSECGGKPCAREHARLGEIRRKLLERIMPEVAPVEREVAELKQAWKRESALHRRDLPFFLYPRSEL